MRHKSSLARSSALGSHDQGINRPVTRDVFLPGDPGSSPKLTQLLASLNSLWVAGLRASVFCGLLTFLFHFIFHKIKNFYNDHISLL